MKRTIKKQFWFSKAEAQDLQKKAKRTCLTEAALVRLLLKGYEPREKPDDRFYDVMRELSAIGNNINQLAHQANARDEATRDEISEAARLVRQTARLVRGRL